MTQQEKDRLLARTRAHVTQVIERIGAAIERTTRSIARLSAESRSLSRGDQISAEGVMKNLSRQTDEWLQMRLSPYFARCDLETREKGECTYYFSKHQFAEESIYSWVAPAARLRFEACGPIEIRVPHGTPLTGTLLRKDSLMVVDCDVTFLSTESLGQPRALVYQKDFTTRKHGFVLPEIVEQMEKAQDQVIRADHRGSFAISGPAGSGKTTLALHRIAYLSLSPDTAPLFPSSHMIVFVQDAGSKAYFSQLLPDLGIRDVAITTFSEWALSVLRLHDIETTHRYGPTEDDRDFYEYEKVAALHAFDPAAAQTATSFALLTRAYAGLSPHSARLFARQKKERILDTIDLTLLLAAQLARHGAIMRHDEYFVQQKNGRLVKREGRLPVTYSLIMIDEFQNYLPEQLKVLMSCRKRADTGLLLVGDFSQQVRFGSIRSFSDVGEEMKDERSIVLAKVYRNTKKILSYIAALGYPVTIPDGMREGKDVHEIACASEKEEVAFVENLVCNNLNTVIGVLALEESLLDIYKRRFSGNAHVFIKTVREAQGVEFDIVCLVGAHRFTAPVDSTLPPRFCAEQRRIRADLLYIALTRAMDELYVLGNDRLSHCLSEAYLQQTSAC